MHVAKDKPVEFLAISWGMPVSGLWMKDALIHRAVILRLLPRVMDGVQARLSTGFIRRAGAHSTLPWVGSMGRGKWLWRGERLLADAEAGEDPAQEVVGAECTGDFAQGLLCKAQVFRQQLASA